MNERTNEETTLPKRLESRDAGGWKRKFEDLSSLGANVWKGSTLPIRAVPLCPSFFFFLFHVSFFISARTHRSLPTTVPSGCLIPILGDVPARSCAIRFVRIFSTRRTVHRSQDSYFYVVVVVDRSTSFESIRDSFGQCERSSGSFVHRGYV